MNPMAAKEDEALSFALEYLQGYDISRENAQTQIPLLAKNAEAQKALGMACRQFPTNHKIYCGDGRNMEAIEDRTIHLVLTSPPYWTLKKYHDSEGQLGAVPDYEAFLSELDKVWEQVFRVLVPGGRLIVVVGDVCLARKEHGRHWVVPLHASIQEHCRALGFDNLAPIIWHKISNAKYEVENGSGFLGKPYEPNAVIKNDIEYLLMQRKPGGYRKPTLGMRLLSIISDGDHKEWFQQIWNLPGASTKEHPAPFPLTLAERLIRMFSFASDTVLDPFMGTGTTNLAASRYGRNSIGFEVDPRYFQLADARLEEATSDVLSVTKFEAIYL